tara:strand:+ start:3542 stop:5257 length:1716 start_codon:yes stop_codon:yes gene_type:complete
VSIAILKASVISKIAAGEVVERPASVVKELLENSVDAGARSVGIEILGSGLGQIKVSDDGSGIPTSEVELAFARHATSKLDSEADLESILTLGFRGEALASIAAISRVELVTRSSSEETGVSLQLVDGVVKGRKSVGVPPGTVIQVDNLFYNVPPRLKFLKSESTERSLIKRIVSKYAMAYPHIRFRYISGNRKGFRTYGNDNLLDVIASVYGTGVAENMIDIREVEQDGVAVSGLVSSPDLSRSSRQEIIFFVNGRLISDAQLNFAVIRAYHTMLMTGRYPIAIISLVVPPSTIDVNVHPTKSEVRFVDKNIVFRAVEKAVRRTLLDGVSKSGVIKSTVVGETFSQRSSWSESDFSNKNYEYPVTEDTLINSRLSGMEMPVLRVIGQTNATFILAEGPDGVYMIDQHAAHERILYEEYVDAAKMDKVRSQMLLQGFTLQLSAEDSEILSKNLDKLTSLGFDIDNFGNDSFIVRAVPAMVDLSDMEQFLMGIVKFRGDDIHGVPQWSEDEIIKRVCRLVAVRAGKVLSYDEQVALLRNLEGCKSPGTCPHGRPTMIHFSLGSIRNQFGRSG